MARRTLVFPPFAFPPPPSPHPLSIPPPPHLLYFTQADRLRAEAAKAALERQRREWEKQKVSQGSHGATHPTLLHDTTHCCPVGQGRREAGGT